MAAVPANSGDPVEVLNRCALTIRRARRLRGEGGMTVQHTIDERDQPKLPARRRENPWLRRAIIFVTCVLLADALFGDEGLAGTIRAGREYRQATEALRQIRQENAALREQQRRLREDPRTIEAVARQELGLIRPGEILAIVR